MQRNLNKRWRLSFVGVHQIVIGAMFLPALSAGREHLRIFVFSAVVKPPIASSWSQLRGIQELVCRRLFSKFECRV